MHQNNLSLSSQNFVVDFLRFNLQFIDKYEIQEVTERPMGRSILTYNYQ